MVSKEAEMKLFANTRLIAYGLLVDESKTMLSLSRRVCVKAFKTNPPFPWDGYIKLFIDSAGGCGTTSYREYMLNTTTLKDEDIASHTHNAGAVKWAVKHGIPTIILRRDLNDSSRSVSRRFGGSPWAWKIRQRLFWYRIRKVMNKVMVVGFDDMIQLDGMPKKGASK